ncbi:chemotaxis protein CheA [Sphingomonas oleivorans]|uniref:Chemotaxis protein CheA n=1 Tax=Sphingomonas oleivorans TaxID=1735121 RepID=A0A2T5FTI3_9SPHN|nr:chemotaxis protein CheA [Sphingomonas oleivorans]PTQ07365.1 chemotaxis protein CheA [Sphingomonas oleivorans]
MDDLLGEFIAETRETLDALAGEVVAWEAAPEDRARLDAIFRFVHTVKGSCGFLDLPRLERLSHAAEDALADVRADRRKPDAALVSAVLAVIDRIGELTDAIETGESLSDGEDAMLIAALAPGAGDARAVTLAASSPSAGPRAVSRSIRLPVELLDRMMAGVSDMVLARNELARSLRDGEGGDGGLGIEAAFERLSQCIGEMRDAISRTRMARIDTLFSALPRLVRDLSADLGKLVCLEVEGGDVELDREMIEMIRDPLTHIVRNAIDHGIESPEERKRAGKPPVGRLRISARQAGNQILIDAIDDGRGIDGDRLVQKAIDAGLVGADQAASMSWSRKLDLIFTAGLSTAREVSAISGRGVGMDVVRANVERIGGLVDVDSRPGAGLRLTLRVPLTLTIIPALTISLAETYFAIPRSAIEEIVRRGGRAVRIDRMGGGLVASIRGERLPLVDLGAVLAGEPGRADERAILVVLKAGGGERYVLGVDAVHDHEELVVKPAAPGVMAAGIYAGATLPDNSRPMLLLDVSGIADAAGVAAGEEAADAPAEVDAAEEELLPALLFRDLDCVERAIGLALVERIEDVPAAAASRSAGRMRLAHDGRILPLFGCGAPLPPDCIRILRMNDGTTQLAYAIDSVIDIVSIGSAQGMAAEPGPIAGVALVEGRPVELLDPYWLFAEGVAQAVSRETGPLCLIVDASDPWTRQVLGPLVSAAGYRVAFQGDEGGAEADVVIATGSAPPPLGLAVPVVRIRSEVQGRGEDDDSIYRYDRTGLLDALRYRIEARRASGRRY